MNVITLPPDSELAQQLRSFVAGRVGARLGEVDERLVTERRLVTALFADVSGFTKLADQLDPEQLLEVIDPVITRLANVVAPYEGYVEKFAGDALLALFGAPVAHEDDAERAVLAAIEMQRELERIRADLPGAAGLTLHVGINTGHGIARMLRSDVRTDYAVLGDSVILAQRLESATPSGETYVSESTYEATRHRFEFEFVGELALKGKSVAARAWRLVRERASAERAQPRGRGVTRRLIGREPELADLRSVIDRIVAAEGGALVTVTGEAGIGKSRLTEEIRRFAESRGARWLEGRSLSYGAGLPYWPYVDLVRRFADVGIEQSPEEAGLRLAAALERAGVSATLPFFARLLGVPATEVDVTRLEPEAFRRGLHDAFKTLLRTISMRTPLVLAIEDLHWADASTVALTRELAPLCVDARVVMYLTARPEAEASLPEIEGARHAIALRPLDEGGVKTLVDAILEGSAPTRLAPFVFERTAGNPFFVEELTRSLVETGALHLDDRIWLIRPGWDAKGLPPTLEGVLASRIDLLPLASAGLLESASVIGRRVRLPLLRGITAGSDIDAALDELVQGGFLDPEEGHDTLLFHHALIQDIAYSRLLRKVRKDVHLRVARTAEELYGSGDDVIDLLARHLYLGEAGVTAIDYLVRAGERARRLFANQEAIEHLTHVVEIGRGEPPFATRLPPLLLELADLYELVGDYDQAFERYSEVRDTTNDARAWRGMGSSLRRRGRIAEALAVVRQAFASDSLKQQDLLPLKLEEIWNLNASGRQDEAVANLRAALTAVGPRRDTIVGQLLMQLARREDAVGEFEAALDHAIEARAMFTEQEDLKSLATASRVVGGVQARLGHYNAASDELRNGLRLAERVGSVEEIGACLINLGMVELRRGSLDEAIACDRRAIEEFERIGHQTGRTNAYANLAEKLMYRGEYAEALHYCEKARDLARAIGYSLWLGDATQTRSSIELRQGHHREAAASAEEAAAVFLGMGAAPRASEALRLAAEAWEKAGENERAREIRSRAPSVSLGA